MKSIDCCFRLLVSTLTGLGRTQAQFPVLGCVQSGYLNDTAEGGLKEFRETNFDQYESLEQHLLDIFIETSSMLCLLICLVSLQNTMAKEYDST